MHTVGSGNFNFYAISILFLALGYSFNIWEKRDKIAPRHCIFLQSVAACIACEAIQLALSAGFDATHDCQVYKSIVFE